MFEGRLMSGPLWTFRNSAWRQQDEEGRFVLAEAFGEALGEGEAPISAGQMLGASRHPAGTCSSAQQFLPEEFEYCPMCGARLQRAEPTAAQVWTPPYGSREGFKLLPRLVDQNRLGQQAGTRFPLPPGGERFSFVSAPMGAARAVLLAIEHLSGRVWSYNDEAKAWRRLDNALGADDMPAWSWSAASDAAGSGLLLPHGGGLAWLRIDWARGALLLERQQGTPLGGALGLQGATVAPLLVEAGLKVLARDDKSGAWRELRGKGDVGAIRAALAGAQGGQPFFGRPVADANRGIAYWPARGGYLRVSGIDQPDGGAWEFRSWAPGAQQPLALIELGPPLRRHHLGLWQLCQFADAAARGGLVNRIVKFDGDPSSDVETVDCGQFLSSGRASFSWYADHWDDVIGGGEMIDPEALKEELRVPLLQFGERGLVLLLKLKPLSSTGEDLSERFSDSAFHHRVKAPALARVVLENREQPELPLCMQRTPGVEPSCEFRLELSRMLEMGVFVHEDWLYLYHPGANECFRWKLQWA